MLLSCDIIIIKLTNNVPLFYHIIRSTYIAQFNKNDIFNLYIYNFSFF